METQTSDASYTQLIERLNRFPQGAPPSETLYRILAELMSEQEAALIAKLPIQPFRAEIAARLWKMDVGPARRVLETLASRAILIDMEEGGESLYVLPPPMAGFFEFSMMRLRNDVDQQLLAELFYQYCTVDDAFMRGLFTGGETQQGRIFVNESVPLPEVHVLEYERASEVIRSATHRGIGLCYCRVKKERVEGACDAPVEICMTFNGPAASLIKHGYAREVDVAEGLDLLQQAYAHNLVQFGENAREGVSFICNCCGCCCEALIAARRFEAFRPIHTTNYLPNIDTTACTGCGKCVTVCPVEAMTLVSTNDARQPNRKKARVQTDICLGCGVCARVCPTSSITLQPRPERVLTPLNSTHRIVAMAIERGQLQDLIFDRQVLWSHRAMAAVLGAILKLPPLKQLMATEQVKSRYLEALVARFAP